MNNRSRRSNAKRLMASATVGAMLLQTVAPAFATVSQVPALYTAPPDVNVMFTLDDSGSMQDETIPDDNNSVGSSMWNSGWTTTTLRDSFKVADQKWRYYRSTQGNPLYYNPTVRYTPWPYAGDDTKTYPNAVPTAACFYFDKLPVATTLPLPVDAPTTIACGTNVRNLAARQPVPASGTDGGGETTGFWPATYFRYIGPGPLKANGQSNDATANPATVAGQGYWQKVEIKPTVAVYPPQSTADSAQPVKGEKRTDCAGTTCTYEEEIKNFANWFQYYRTRALMAKGAAMQAFARQGTNLRVGFASLHGSSTIDGFANTPLIKRGVRKFEGTDRWAFYADVYKTGASGYTPLRYSADVVGTYFSRTDHNGPWGASPGRVPVDQSKHAACRRNFHLLTSDGYWNTNDEPNGNLPSTRNVGNADDFTNYTAPVWHGSATGTPDPVFGNANTFGFTIDPFKDGNSNTLSDYAAYYWKRDLRGDLDNIVPTSTRDPAYWQHLTTYTLGIGVSSTNPAIATSEQRDALVRDKTSVTWGGFPTTNALKGDDFVHASLSGHGQFFLAVDPTGLADSMTSALREATADPSSMANVVTSTPQVSDQTGVYQATYTPGEWSGRLYNFLQATDGSVNTAPSNAQWEASNKMPAHDLRNIYTWNPNTNQGTPFKNLSDLTPAQQTALGNDQTLLDFLRGSDAKELAKGGSFRDRVRYKVGTVTGGVLGDIVNGSPIKGPTAGGGFERLPTSVPGQGTYQAYRSDANVELNKLRNTLFAGANDGMLHAFDRLTGIERFAFVPNSVFSVPRSLTGTEQKLKMLSDRNYSHRYTVDGPPQIGDAYIRQGGTAWGTVLLGSTGAGARSVFAMDVTNPVVETNGFDKNKLLWEFSEADATDGADMGHVISYPHIAKMKANADGTGGEWVAIFGNGYDSASGRAALFIVSLQTGKVVKKIYAGNDTGNGLSQPNFTVNNNREVIAIYAGDVKGNLWKFDVDNVDTAEWKVAFGGTPLFTGSVNQPISVMPEITFHPNGGTLVSFGTGKIFEVEDMAATWTPNVNLNTQAIYGIWDKPGETTGFSGTGTLVQRLLTGVTSATDSTLGGTSIQKPGGGAGETVFDPAIHRGWYLNLLPGPSGERVNVNPQQVERVLLVVSNKAESDPCKSGGSARLFVLNPITGSAPVFGVLDSNGDTVINSADRGFNVKTFASAVLSLPTLQTKKAYTDQIVTERVGTRGQTGERLGGVENRPTPTADCARWLLAGSSNTSIEGLPIRLCADGTPRISWRQLK